MLDLRGIIDITNNYCVENGGMLRSRQIRGLAQAITEKVNEELKVLNDRIAALESHHRVYAQPRMGNTPPNMNAGYHKIEKPEKRHEGQTRLEAINGEEE